MTIHTVRDESKCYFLVNAYVMFLQDLTAKCVDGAISDNIEELVESPDWLGLQVECIEAIMKSSSLLVPDEFYIYEALQRWLMNQRKTEPEDSVMDYMKSVSMF